jgi:hypothetical protein
VPHKRVFMAEYMDANTKNMCLILTRFWPALSRLFVLEDFPEEPTAFSVVVIYHASSTHLVVINVTEY